MGFFDGTEQKVSRPLSAPGSPRDRSGMMTPGDFASLQEGREGLSTEDYIAWKLPEEEDTDDYPFPLTLRSPKTKNGMVVGNLSVGTMSPGLMGMGGGVGGTSPADSGSNATSPTFGNDGDHSSGKRGIVGLGLHGAERDYAMQRMVNGVAAS